MSWLWSLIPVEYRVGIATGALLAALAGVGGTALVLHHQWYGEGYTAGAAATTARYEKLMADEAAANQAAIAAANKQLIATADQLDKTNAALDVALAQLEAGSGGADASSLGLDAARMKALGGIK